MAEEPKAEFKFSDREDLRVGQVPKVGVGMLGYAFMGKAYANALKKIPYIYYPPAAVPRLVSIGGRSLEQVAYAARRYGFERHTTDWRQIVSDPDVQLFCNGAANDAHAEPCIAAAQAGKHIICEKPLARNAPEAKAMRDAVANAGVKALCAFNNRFVPANRLARELIQEGKLGEIYHFRARYLQEWVLDPNLPLLWRLEAEKAGSGPLGDLGAHIIDLGRFLVGEVKAVTGVVRTFIKERPLLDDPGKKGKVDVDDAFAATIEFKNGAIGTLEASRLAPGHKNYNCWEVNGSKGSLMFNFEHLNQLQVYFTGDDPRTLGFRDVSVTEHYHPFYKNWWPHGHIIGFEHSFVHEIHHVLDCIVNDKQIGPDGATFEDGYRNAVICDAILESARTGKRVEVRFE